MSAGSRVILADTSDRAGGLFVPPWRASVSFTCSSDRSDTDDPAHHLLMPGGVLAAAPPSTPRRRARPRRRLCGRPAAHAGHAGPVLRPGPRHEPPAAAPRLASLALAPAGTGCGGHGRAIASVSRRSLQWELPAHRSCIPERFGLFTIVLGQAVIYVVSGATATHWAGGSTAVAAVASCWPARGGAPGAGPGPGSGTPPGGALKSVSGARTSSSDSGVSALHRIVVMGLSFAELPERFTSR